MGASGGSAARHGWNHVDGVARADRSVEIGRLAGYEDVDMRTKPWTGIDQPVTQAGYARIELTQDGIDRLPVERLAPLGAGEEVEQIAREEDGRHVPPRQSRTSDSTAQISGRSAVIRSHERPSSRLCHNCPDLVPNAIPTGSSVSRAMASRSTER